MYPVAPAITAVLVAASEVVEEADDDDDDAAAVGRRLAIDTGLTMKAVTEAARSNTRAKSVNLMVPRALGWWIEMAVAKKMDGAR